MNAARAICDRSGFEYPLRELVKTWDGLMVHPRWHEPRHPQDFVTGRKESALPYSRPEAADRFLSAPVLPSDL